MQFDFAALNTCLQGLDHLFIDISRLTPEAGYEEKIGGYGTVQVSTLDSGTPGALLVAAKTIRLKALHREPERLAFRLARELKIWAGFRHPHILPLLGYYIDKEHRTAVLISQFMIHSDLMDYIDQQKPLWEARLHLVRDLTDGLAYLHQQTPPVVHGDIKLRNVLVNASKRAILADFGLSKALEGGSTGLTTSRGLKGTLRLYSPELIRDQDCLHCLPSDIWAWGCLVLEALTDIMPYADKRSEHSIIIALMHDEPPSDIAKLSFPVSDLKTLLARCWTIQPSERPSVVDCLRAIESALLTPLLAVDIDRPPKSVKQIRADNEARENDQTEPEWHCSICGCPDSFAVDRRDGPKGEKSLCEPCGELYHRYRQTKDVVDNEDPDYHVRLRQAEVNERKRKRPVKAESESVLGDAVDETPDVTSLAHVGDDDGIPWLSRAASLLRPAKRIKTPASPPSPPLEAARIAEEEVKLEKLAPPQKPDTTPFPTAIVAQPFPPPDLIPNVPDFDPETPQWMRRAVQELRAKYENDLFEAVIRPHQLGPASSMYWRIMCYDCFGKMYSAGPDETLLNFEVHLKNRQHRENVNARLSAAALIAERYSRWGSLSKRAVNNKADGPS